MTRKKLILGTLAILLLAGGSLFYYFDEEGSDVVVVNRTAHPIELAQLVVHDPNGSIFTEAFGPIPPGAQRQHRFRLGEARVEVTVRQGTRKRSAECGEVNALASHFLVEVDDSAPLTCERFMDPESAASQK